MQSAEVLVAEATLLLGASSVVAVLLRGRSASVRHAVWVLTLAGLLVLPVAELVLPKVEIRVLPPTAWTKPPCGASLF